MFGYAMGDPINNSDPFGLECAAVRSTCYRIREGISYLMSFGFATACGRAGLSASFRYSSEYSQRYFDNEGGVSQYDEHGNTIIMQTTQNGDNVIAFDYFRQNGSAADWARHLAHEEWHAANGSNEVMASMAGDECGAGGNYNQ